MMVDPPAADDVSTRSKRQNMISSKTLSSLYLSILDLQCHLKIKAYFSNMLLSFVNFNQINFDQWEIARLRIDEKLSRSKQDRFWTGFMTAASMF